VIPRSLRPSLDGLPRSATLAINERSAALVAEGRDVYRFGLGQSPFPVPEHVVASLREHAHEKDYLPVEGLPALRRAVRAFHRREDGLDLPHVLVGPGSKELMFLLQLAYAGELVLPSPCWVSYGPQARLLERGLRSIPTDFADRWRLTGRALEAFCADRPGRPRVLLLNYPGNPDGLSYTAAELEALAEVARRHHLIVVSDEIYGPLHHRGENVSIGRFYPEGTIVSGGLSKWCGAGGWRLGTFAFPEGLCWLKDAMAVAASETFTSVAAPVQHAAVTAFTELDRRYLEDSRRVLRSLARSIVGRLRSAGVRVHDLEGAFYLFADLSECPGAQGFSGSRALCEQLLQDTGVAVLPGADFSRAEGELSMRLAYVDFDGEAALSLASEVHGELSERDLLPVTGRLLAGVDALCGWLA